MGNLQMVHSDRFWTGRRFDNSRVPPDLQLPGLVHAEFRFLPTVCKKFLDPRDPQSPCPFCPGRFSCDDRDERFRMLTYAGLLDLFPLNGTHSP